MRTFHSKGASSSRLSVQLIGSKELAAALAAAKGRAEAEAGRALYLEAEAVMAESKRLVPVDMGTLRNSGLVNPPKTENGITEVQLGYGGASSAYALFIHEGVGPAVGRPAFMPPVAPFKEWAKRVLGDESLGFVIARAVGRRGLAPRKFLEIPLKNRASTMAARLATRIRRALASGTA